MKLKEVVFKIKSKFIYKNPEKRSEWLKSEGYRIGNNCEIYPNVTFGSEYYLIKLGDNVKLTSGVTFIPHDGSVHVLRNLGFGENIDLFGEIVLGNNVFVGNHVIFLPGVHIGQNCIIGAGSIVTKDIPDNSVAAGIPAKRITSVEEYYNKHMDHFDFTKNMNKEEKKSYLLKKFRINDTPK